MFIRRGAAGLGLALVLVLTSHVRADKPDSSAHRAAVSADDWKKAVTTPLERGEIDRLLAAQHQRAGVKPLPRTTDEQFIRRVHLDVTGKLPSPSAISDFVADSAADKRAKLIDKLLESDDFGTHWAAYWREVVTVRLTDVFGRGLARPFERWMAKSLQENKRWSAIVREMLTYTGEARYTDEKSGPAYFLGGHSGTDAVVEQAAETARILLGIQMNCAQCHDHPFDVWKREQFHELAAYFARNRPRPIREEERFVGIALGGSRGFGPPGRFGGGEHRMPDKNNTNSRFGGTTVHPKFIDGKAPARGLSDTERRESLVKAITAQDNPWFAAAFVNRVWGELLGQSFYTPVDDLGPQKEAVFGTVLARVAGAFRGSDYDIKGLYRVILNSDAFQRQSKSANPGDHLLFTAVYPTRLRPNALWDSLQHAVGRIGERGFGRPGGFGGFASGRFGGTGVEAQLKTEFNFDPSLKADDVEGSIPQALILMNNPSLQERVRVGRDTFLGRLLNANESDATVLDKVYLQALARRPTEREKVRCLDHVKKAGSRAEAFEDVLWALLNSTEFQTRR